MHDTTQAPLVSRQAEGLKGRIRVPGDKSMSHRALMFGAVAIGETTIKGLLEAEDVVNTAKAMTALGADANRGADGIWRVQGVGIAGCDHAGCKYVSILIGHALAVAEEEAIALQPLIQKVRIVDIAVG